MSRLNAYVLEALRSPREKLSRGQHLLRQSWELAAHCWRQLQRHRAEGMAAELTYRTIFSLIPVVVLGLVMFRVVGGLDEVKNTVELQLYNFFGVPEIPDAYLVPMTAQSLSESTASAEETSQVDDNAESIEVADNPGQGPITEPAGTGPGGFVVSEARAGDNGLGDEGARSGDGDLSRDDATRASPGVDSGAPMQVDLDAAMDVEPTDQGEAPETDLPESSETNQASEARAGFRRVLHERTNNIANIDFKSIGVFGLLLFIYAAVALADSTEHLFNRIYDAPSQRPIHIRLAIHWSIITLGSGLLAMSLYMTSQVVDWFVEIGAGSTSRLVLNHLLSILASWVLLFLLYALMPNTNVSVRSAATGSLVSALLWEGAKFGFQIYVAKAVPYSALYGSLGLIPLFLFWIYVTWLIVLFGLILTYTLQTLGGRELRQGEWREDALPSGDPDWMLPIMCEVSHAFQEGNAIDNQTLADQLGLSSRIVHDMTNRLVEAGTLRRVKRGAGEEDALTLARPAEKIGVDEILDLAHHARPTSDHPAWKTLASLKQAERQAAVGKTLADVRF